MKTRASHDRADGKITTRGLNNIGNTCWLNAVIQCIYFLIALLSIRSSKPLSEYVKRSQIYTLFEQMTRGGKSVSPKNVQDWFLKDSHGSMSFARGETNTAQEGWRFISQHECLTAAFKKTLEIVIERSVSCQFCKGKQRTKRTNSAEEANEWQQSAIEILSTIVLSKEIKVKSLLFKKKRKHRTNCLAGRDRTDADLASDGAEILFG